MLKNPTLVSKELIAGRINKDLLQDAKNRFDLNQYFRPPPSKV